jgi:hypothetical protein
MIGTKGTLKHIRTQIHHVPILFCPVCHRIEVHHLIKHEYDILAEYAHSDGAFEVDFAEYVDLKETFLYDNCVSHEGEDPYNIVNYQIDMSLDLLTFAKTIQDTVWEDQLKSRLQVLSTRRNKLKNRKSAKTKK